MAIARRSLRIQAIKKNPGASTSSTITTTHNGDGAPKRTRTRAGNPDDDDEQKGRKKKPARKREKTGTEKKMNAKTASAIEDVPLEVVFEIFCYLGPRDLLYLAWTSKDFRGILMSRKSEYIWRAARQTVPDLPPRPSDLNEVQYARLAFAPYCYACNASKGRCHNVLWEFRVRLCKKCEARLPEYDTRYILVQPPEFREFQVLPCVYIKVGQDLKRCGSNRCAENLREEFSALQDDEEREKWLVRKQKELKDIRAHSKLCEAWHETQLQHQRREELDKIRRERLLNIIERLSRIGWGEEVEIMSKQKDMAWYTFTSHKLVKQPTKLSDYGWKRIEQELVKFVSEKKLHRLARSYRDVIQKRYNGFRSVYQSIYKTCDRQEPFPSLGDFVMYPPVEDLIWDTPFEEELNLADLQPKLSEHFASLVAEWKPAKIQELLKIMQKSGIAGATVSDLGDSVFRCSRCAIKMRYPHVFFHGCFMSYRQERASKRLGAWFMYSIDASTPAAYGMGPWITDKLTFCYTGSLSSGLL